jgi:vancomycin resistance protein YoaR
LIVNLAEPKIKTETINNLGIKEKIGVGISNFSGSPANRRHNIAVGSAKLNGILLKPGEEFKLMPALGNISSAAGYLPELVIKDNKTTPELGGGLCQVGTTMFRAALSSGLPITERRPHKYRVSYYEPAGTDATIYDPRPDVRFVNDTANHVLIQTKITGNVVTFEFWGTHDGRKVVFEGNNKTEDLTQLKPKIFNITRPGPTKFIETDTLPPGVKKQTESAHNGADATFYRYITLPGAEEKKETWNSHYIAWQAVVLVGVEKKTDGVPIPDINAPADPVEPAIPVVPTP